MTVCETEISVVIPCYNAEKWVGRAIDSVLAQEGVSVEVIVIDDGSTDGSLDVIRTYGDRIRWEIGPNRGACAARNRGLQLSRAEYVMFLDADDYLKGPFLSSAGDALRLKNADVAFGRILVEKDGGNTPFHPAMTEAAAEVMRGFLENGFVPPCGTVWSTSFIRGIGGWKDNLRRHQDYELAFRALSKDPRITFFKGGYGIYFQHAAEGRISSKSDIETVQDQADVIRFVKQCVDSTDLSERDKARLMQKRAYRLWQQTCRGGDPTSMKLGRALYAEFGGTGHMGSFPHRIVASALGLRAKEWIALRMARLRRDTDSPAAFDRT